MNKKLTRSSSNKVIAGACGGLGEYFNIDPVLVRVIVAACIFLGGFGLLLYILMWILVPEA